MADPAGGALKQARKLPIPKAHWTPRYIRDRIALSRWQKRHPQAPWLVRQAVEVLDQWLNPSDTVVEFGSGRSTVWFASRVAHVVSVEHHQPWHAAVTQKLADQGITNVAYTLAPEQPAPYVAAADNALKGKADLILVDGIYRDACLLWALERLKPDGVIVLDNSNRYLPSKAKGPGSIGTHAAPANDAYARFAKHTAAWRHVRFWDGISETLMVFPRA